MRDFVLSLAPTGMLPDRSMTPHVPLTPAEVADDVVRCQEFGITNVHIHARDDQGRPSGDPALYRRYIEAIRSRIADMPICVSCSGRVDPAFESRSQVLHLSGELKPDMASLTLSSLNFARSASINSPDTIVQLAELMQEKSIIPELEIFDLGMLNYARYLIERGHIKPPFYFNIILGNIASAQADMLHLSTLIRDLPAGALWSVGGIGAVQLTANVLSLAQGGGVRTGLEDNIWFDQNRTYACTNQELVSRCHQIAAVLERPLMPHQAFKAWLSGKK